MADLTIAVGGTAVSVHLGPAPDAVLDAAALAALAGKASLTDLLSTTALKGAAMVGFKQTATGAVARTVLAKLQESALISAEDFGALGDGATDDSAAVQAGIDHLNSIGGGFLSLQFGKHYKFNVTLKAGVWIGTHLPGSTYPPSSLSSCRVSPFATGWAVDTPVGSTLCCGVSGIDFTGFGAGTNAGGVQFRNVTWGGVVNCSFDQFTLQGLLVSVAVACTFEWLRTTNVLLTRPPATRTGAIDIAGTDHYLYKIQANPGVSGAVTDANLNCCSLVVRGAEHFISDCSGEFGDIGVVIIANDSRISAVRGDLNRGHGWLIEGNGNQLSIPLARSNGQATTNTYDAFHVTGTNNTLVAPKIANSGANVHRYAINDQSTVSDTNKNQFLFPYVVVSSFVTAAFNHPTGASAQWAFTPGPSKTLTANSATPSVTAYENFITANSGATTITDFTGGVNGQRLTILCNDANTTVQHNGTTITLPGGVSRKLRSGHYYTFTRSGLWRLVSTSDLDLYERLSIIGDAAATLTYGTSAPTNVWVTPLTADRAVTLATAGLQGGETFHIVRSAAATGAFNLNVGTGPLKALAAGQWCDVKYSASSAAWMLVRFGSL